MGLGANNNKQHNQQQNKQKKQKHNKSREETEDVWCCAVCTYQNNMLLGYCELCGCKKPDKPSIVKRGVYSENNAQNEDNSSPSPPSPQPQSTDINVLDVTQGNDSSQIQFENMLPINDNQSNEENASKHHQQIPNLLHIPKRNGLHRHTQSESNVLMTKQRAAKYWACSVCTFNENPIDYPVCKMCSALPPERPPSASSDNLPQKKKEKTKKVSKHILDESIDVEMDPLGHQRSTSVTKVSIMDESTVHNNQQSNNNQKAQDLLGLIPKKAPNPSLLQINGGVGYHNATASGQNILRGMRPYDVPDLPPESMQQKNEKKSIANMGVEVGKNKGKESGIGGFFGKVVNGWSARKRAQSTDDESGSKSRSRSPFGKKKEEKKEPKRNISVATMPKKQQEKIAKRLSGLHTKKDLLRELESSQIKLQKKLKQHAAKVMTLKSRMNVMESQRLQELKQWNAWYVLELVDLGKEYYDHFLSLINHQIELEKLHIECFTEKLQRLENATKRIKRNGKKWNIDDIRNNIEVAFHTAWRIRLSQDVPDKQD